MKRILIAVSIVLLIPTIAFGGTRVSRELLSAAVDLTPTGTFVDVGSEFNVNGTDSIGILATVGTGNASEVKARLMAKHESAGDGEYPIPLDLSNNLTITANDIYYEYEVTASSTEYKFMKWLLDGTVPIIQLQMASDFASGDNATVSSLIITEKK